MTQAQSRAVYLIGFPLLVLLGGLLGSFKNPYRNDSFRIILPGLFLLNALEWFVLSLRMLWKVLGAICSLLTGLLFVFLCRYLTAANFANVSTFFLLGMFAHGLLLWFLAADRVEKSIVLAQDLTTAFVVLLGLDLNLKGLAASLSAAPTATAGFLFWSPLAATYLWTTGVVLKPNKQAQMMLVLAIVQIGIGLFDLELIWHIAWGRPSAFVAWFAALGVAGYLAKSWQAHPLD